MTRDEIRQQYLAETAAATPASAPGPVAPDPSASALTQIMQGGLSQPQNRNEIAASYSADPREAFAAGFRSSILGTSLTNEQRSQFLEHAHPNYNAAGYGAGLGMQLFAGGAGAPAMGRGAVAAGRMAPELALRGGGAAIRYGAAPYYAAHTFDPAGTGALWYAGKYGQKLANAMRDTRLGNSATAGRLAAEGPPETEPAMRALEKVLRDILGGHR